MALFNLFNEPESETWIDRLQEAAYTSPGGNRIVFEYENVGKDLEKHGSAFNFPDAKGTYVQGLGHSGHQIPMNVIFSGPDCDIIADAFELILLEDGIGKLEHPVYGEIDVMPLGKISRGDDLVTAANQAIVGVTFFETIGLVYPTSQTDPAADVLAAMDAYNDAMAAALERQLALDSALRIASFKNSYNRLLNAAEAGLRSVADFQAGIQRKFDAVTDSINRGIDILVGQPLTLAYQTSIMINAPARAITAGTARLKAYKNLAGDILNSPIRIPGLKTTSLNEMFTSEMFASNYVGAVVISSVNSQFESKTEALEFASTLLEMFDDLTVWRDANYELYDQIDTGEAYQALLAAVAVAAGFIVENSFSLKQERSFFLKKDRALFDLVYELYGSVDDKIDFFICSNNLSGFDILELKKGREIVYYV